jgi:alpha-L-fucosidase
MKLHPFLICAAGLAALPLLAQVRPSSRDAKTVAAEHSDIGVVEDKSIPAVHTQHPEAQWFPEAGFGLFIHWGISSVRAMNISWPMIPGRALATQRITDPAERERIVRARDYNLNGKPNSITPNEYFSMAKDFNPQRYDPDRWLAAAKAAGFEYVVLTTKHHEGFALWPSAHGDFDTRNYMGGRDLLRPYVEACRKHGLKVGFYYSPPDWYFDRNYKNFIYGRGAKNNPELPPVGPDLKPRATKPSDAELAAHRAAYVAKVNGQIEELLTRYGKIDLLWFDGRPEGCDASTCTSQERIRELQPGIVINPRLHGRGDFITYERTLGTAKVATGWAEFCNTWTTGWSHQEIPFRAPGFVLGQLATCRSLQVNYLLGVGPMATGEFCDGIYQNMAIVRDWMKTHRTAVTRTKPLPPGESASVPATASGPVRYLFALPQFKAGGTYEKDLLPAADTTLTLTGVAKPTAVSLLRDGGTLSYDYRGTTLLVQLPASKRSQLVDVVRVELSTPR